MFLSTKKKIWFGILTTLIIILSGYGIFVFKERQEHKYAAAKIAEYCQNPKIDLAASGYKFKKEMYPDIQTKISTKKFDNIYTNVIIRYDDKSVEEGLKQGVSELCTTSKSKLPPRTFLFWYQLNDAYSVMGIAENKVELGRVGSDLGNVVKFFVIKNDTQAATHGFEFTTRIHRSHESKDRYRRITGKDIREIAMIVLRDNVPSVLQ